MQRYNLYDFIVGYYKNCTFPSKYSWKKIFSFKVNEQYERLCECETNHEDFIQYRQIQLCLQESPVWMFAKKYPDILQYCFSVAQFIAYLGYVKPDCPKCNAINLAANFTLYVLVYCGVVQRARLKFNRFVLKHFGVNIFRTLTVLNRVEYVNSLLGMPVN